MALMHSRLLAQFRRQIKSHHPQRFRPLLFPLEESASTAAVALIHNRCQSPLSSGSSSSSGCCYFTSGSDQHSFFQQQLEELEKERKSVLGPDSSTDGDDLIATGNKISQQASTTTSTERRVDAKPPPPDDDASSSKEEEEEEEFEMDMEDLHAEREALFQFSAEEKQAWGGQSSSINAHPSETRLSPKLLQEIEEARAAAAAAAVMETSANTTTIMESSSSSTSATASTTTSNNTQHHESFSHLSPDGTSIHMVDVGHKQVTTRMARAQSKVLLPPEVLEAFEWQESSSSSELVGPKGPIFATAKIAGIMAAKKTSDLIPLCHPLPLDQVQIDIHYLAASHEIVIDCTCRVTHKTGVEMEALMGASVAALTIYDMIKAVSHRVEITNTKLISKTGGKRIIE